MWLIKECGWPPGKQEEQYWVRSTSGHKTLCTHRSNKVCLNIQGVQLCTTTVFDVPISESRADVIFGMPWLDMVSPLMWDCKKMYMTMWGDGEMVVLKSTTYDEGV